MTFTEFKKSYEIKEVIDVSSKTPDEPLLSICIQTYNHIKYLDRCLDSILTQNVSFDFEILIGEDNSSDGTRELCLQYAEKYPDKIRLFLHHRENQIPIKGYPSSNFNAFYNLFSAKGKYIATCDGDDYWNDPQKVQKQVEFLENNPSYVIAYHAFREVDKEDQHFEDSESLLQPTEDISANSLKKGDSHPLLLTICFRNLIREIPLEIINVINIDTFLLSLLGHFGAAKYLSEIEPASYRKHQEGIWSKKRKKLKFQFKILTYSKLTEYYQNIGDSQMANFYKVKLRNIYKMLIAILLRKGELKEVYKAALQLWKIKKH